MFKFENNDKLKFEIKNCILSKGYTIKQVSAKLDMLPQTYQNLVNKKNLSFADVNRILEAIGLELYIEFVEKDDDKDKQTGCNY